MLFRSKKEVELSKFIYSIRYNTNMSEKKPVLVAIFAHPDDEAFGPGGTLAIYGKTHDVYLICVTRGQAGHNNADQDRPIQEIREEELRNSAKLLGIKSLFFLDYEDGALSNNQYHAIANDIQVLLDELKPETLMTFEMRGVSGHLDHIAVSMIVHYVFHKISYAKELMLYCEKEEVIKNFRDYFVYVPHGYEDGQIDKIIDITRVWDTKVKAMYEHKSQIKDVNTILYGLKEDVKEECFLIHRKDDDSIRS